MDAVRIVEDEVRELIRRRGLDPLRQAGEVRRLVEAAVSDYERARPHGAATADWSVGGRAKVCL